MNDLYIRRYEDGLVALDIRTWETHSFGAQLVPLVDEIRQDLDERALTVDEIVAGLSGELNAEEQSGAPGSGDRVANLRKFVLLVASSLAIRRN